METSVVSPVIAPSKVRRTGWMAMILAGVLAGAAGLMHFAYLNGIATDLGTTRAVVTAVERIPQGALVTAEMLELTEIPVKFLPDKQYPSYFNPEDLLDGNTIALINIDPGQYIQPDMVSRNLVTQNRRAVPISVNPVTSVANSVRSGNYVDLVSSFVDAEGQQITDFLLQNVRVIAVDTRTLSPEGIHAQPYIPASADGDLKLTPTTIVILDLSPEEALKVVHAENFAQELRLIIRRLDDEETPSIKPVIQPTMP